jgi:hypothetical protein
MTRCVKFICFSLPSHHHFTPRVFRLVQINLADAERKIPFMKAAALEGERNKPFEAWRAEEAKTKY